MNYFIYFVVYFVYGIILILQFLMMARAIMSWFVQDDSPSRIYDFLYYATEPVIYPVRSLLHKLGLAGDGMMIDFSFLITVMLLWVVQLMLPAVSI